MDAVGTKSLGCGNSYKDGRCSDGSDPDNCVYESAAEKGAAKCIGLFHLVTIPEKYTCNDQRGLLKCIKNEFDTVE